MENELTYRIYCIRHGLDPETGHAARAFEEFLAGCPIEEWWDAMNAEAEERKFWEYA